MRGVWERLTLALAGALLVGCDGADPAVAAGAGSATSAAIALVVALRRRGKERVAHRWIALVRSLDMEVGSSSSPLVMTGTREALAVRVEAHGVGGALGLPATRVGVTLQERLPPALVPAGDEVPLEGDWPASPLRRGFVRRVAAHEAVRAAQELEWSVSLRADSVWLSSARFADDPEELELVLAHACRIALRVPRAIGEVPAAAPTEPRALADALRMRLDEDGRGLSGRRGDRAVRVRLLSESGGWTIHVELDLGPLPREAEILLLDRSASSLPLAPAKWGIEAKLGGQLERMFRARGVRAADFDLLTDPVRKILLRLPRVAWIWIAELTVVALRTEQLDPATMASLLDGLVALSMALGDPGSGSPYRISSKPRGGDGA